MALPPGGTFVDDDGSVHEPSIEGVAHARITLGCNPPDNDRYCPRDAVTRAQMAAFFVRALRLPESEVPGIFYKSDVRAQITDSVIDD